MYVQIRTEWPEVAEVRPDVADAGVRGAAAGLPQHVLAGVEADYDRPGTPGQPPGQQPGPAGQVEDGSDGPAEAALVGAAAVTAVTVIGLRHGLAPFAPSVHLVVPWLPLIGIALACLVVARVSSLIPAAIALRRPPLELAGAQE